MSMNFKGKLPIPKEVKERFPLTKEMAEATWVLQPSDHEAFGLSVAESLILGTPVLITDIPAFREIGCNETNSIMFDLDMKNDKLSDDVKLKVTNFYNSVFDSLNNEDKDIIVDATDDAREKIYDILQKSYFILKNKYTIESIDIKDENCEYEYSDGVYSANIVVDIKYEVSKVFFGINKTVNEKSFFTKIIFKDGSWIINDVENFSL